ncbi:unnamed protein product [Ilex paraguariensis]|uniref:Transposase n=1 Tax=Ilex paraguariensis TaxID=185542 RepID=A0ABC8T7P7_9AQUA
MEFTMRSCKCEQKCPGGLVTDNLGHQQQDHPSTCQVQSHQPSSTYSHAYQPQQTSYQCPPSSSEPQASLPQADVGSSDSTPVQRRTKGRGPTRCLKLWRDGKRISVTINELGQPIGPEAQKLTSFLGTLARDGHLAPLTYINWKAMPDANKENMWQQVPPKFDIDPKGKTWVLKSLGKKWKDWKAKLKAAHYITHTTDEERLADRDERVLPDQWSNLILHWNSEEVEKRSATNRANRAQQKFNHTTGQKSFARIREEQREKRPDGKEPSRAELFILTRTRKNGEPVNEASSALIERLRERATQQQETSQNSTVQKDIFSQVMGEDRHGPIRNFGLGPSPSDIGVAKPTRAEAIRMVSEANAEVREVKQRMVAMEQTCAQMAAQMATMMSMMSNMQTRFPDKNQTDVANTSNGSEGSPQHRVHSTPSCHEAPSYETRARKKGKMQNARTN